ncbi:MAG: dihydropyrimidinase [Bacteroidetes bacterium]|nr:dihydropyrimidinase [Bacteroidota bacterium]
MDILIKNGTIVNAGIAFRSNIWISDGIILSVELERIHDPFGTKIIDASGKLIMPGGIDPHVHLHLPTTAGYSSDDFYSGSRAALAGGTTTIIDFVTPARGESLLQALDVRRKEAVNCMVDYSFHMGITWWGKKVKEEIGICMEKEQISSFKAYLAYRNTIGISYEELEEAMVEIQAHGGLLLVHCEEGDEIETLQRQFLNNGHTSPRYHALSRPPEVETKSVKKVLDLVEKTGCRTYLVHISAASSMEAIAQAKTRGLPIFAETCMQYLLLNEEKYQGSFVETAPYVMSPPLRSEENRLALWECVKSGLIDVVATDHCPFNLIGGKDHGRDDFTKIPNGAGSIEFRLPLLYQFGVNGRQITEKQYVSLVSANPARIFGFSRHKGDISQGKAADLVIWDPLKKQTISGKSQYQHCDHNIFEGFQVRGWPETVIHKGKIYPY